MDGSNGVDENTRNTDQRKLRPQNTRTSCEQAGSEFLSQTFVTRTTLISVLMPAQMQRPEAVRGTDGFLSEFSLPQGNPTQPVREQTTQSTQVVGVAVVLVLRMRAGKGRPCAP